MMLTDLFCFCTQKSFLMMLVITSGMLDIESRSAMIKPNTIPTVLQPRGQGEITGIKSLILRPHDTLILGV